jgi:small-conductance mechanosensitive channel
MERIAELELLGQPVTEYVVAAAIILGAVVVLQIAKRVLVARLKNQDSPAVRAVRRFLFPMLHIAALYAAVRTIDLPPDAARAAEVVFLILLSWFLIRLTISLADRGINNYVERTRSAEEKNRIRPLLAVLNLVIWIVGVLFLLDNLGFQISTVVAGLGISGIAVALAAQAVLGDLFSYFVIFMDRPFEIGDFVIFGDVLGTIEKIGVKTTRLRSLGGEEIIVSNADLTSSRVRNYKRMEERRIVFGFGVLYETEPEKLRAIPDLVQEIAARQELVRFDRAHFKSFGNSSLDFEVVYYVLSPDYTTYMNIQQAINLAIFEAFAEKGIGFAYPTTTVYLAGASEPARPRAVPSAPGAGSGADGGDAPEQ